ncbi:MAG: hypothetical protein QOD06_2389 [Candidatus Binatota bacterium]|jgi:glycosyltransferase involved in cell wall biosynthesis|nr:hypothetical protein [Candidatus Binatota bacterium]
MTRVLFFTGSFKIGGSERYLVSVLEHLDRTRFDPEVACLDERGPLREQVRALGVPVRSFPIAGGLLRASSIASIPRAASWIRFRRFDVVQCWMNYPNVIGGLATLLSRSPVLVCAVRGVHRAGAFHHPNPLLERLHHWVCRRADRVLVNGASLRSFVRARLGVPEDRIVLIPNGVNEHRFAPDAGRRAEVRAALGIADSLLGIIYVGRLEREKGCFEAINGFLASGILDARLLVIGDGPERIALETLARGSAAGERIRFLGNRSDISDLLNGSDVFVFPTYGEGFPNALVEAMASALPIVTSDVPPIRELVRDGSQALLVAPRDADGVARALRGLASDPELRQKLRLAARARALDFRLTSSIRRYEELYGSLVEAHRKPPLERGLCT